MHKRGFALPTPEAFRYFMTVYARLEIDLPIDRDAATGSMEASPASKPLAGVPKNPDHIQQALAEYHRDAPWRSRNGSGQSIWGTMQTVLSRAARGALDNYCRLAPALLAAELMRDEVRQSAPPAAAATATLRDLESRLDERGLLAPYVATRVVREGLVRFADLLEAPLRGFTEPVEDFAFVLGQLSTTYHSLKGVMVYADTKVNQHGTYFDMQMETLKSRAISIERVFIYEHDNKDKVREIEQSQRTHAEEALADCSQGGSYKSYLVSSVYATAMSKDREPSTLGAANKETALPSFVIIDHEHPTERVVTQEFGPLEHYAMSAYKTDISRKAEEFELLKNHADDADAAD